jgi:nucleoside-diphosphate-sugar epimerase
MRVFVTGATGWVGSALVPSLLASGHEVIGLARSSSSADALVGVGAGVLRGSLDDLDVLRAGAADSDGVVHLAFNHDFDQYEAANQGDRDAIATMGVALAGSDRPLVIASGVATTATGRPSTEDDPADPGFPRSAASALTLDLATQGVRSSVVRLPPTTHGTGDAGFIRWLVDIARDKGVAGYVGDGTNVWPATHVSDAARVFQSALEVGAAGSVWHAIAEEGVPTRAIAEVIGRHLSLPVASIDPAAAMDHFGFLGMIWGGDLPTSSALTRARLDWHPTGPTLLEDLETGSYFA